MPSIGAPELLIILLIVVLIFGGSRLRDVLRSLGSGVREFREAAQGEPEKKPAPEEKQEPPTPPAA